MSAIGLEQYDAQSGEDPPLGLILCADKSTEHVELLRLEQSGIRVAQYLTELRPKELLEQKLHKSIKLARERLARVEHAHGDQQRFPRRSPRPPPRIQRTTALRRALCPC